MALNNLPVMKCPKLWRQKANQLLTYHYFFSFLNIFKMFKTIHYCYGSLFCCLLPISWMQVINATSNLSIDPLNTLHWWGIWHGFNAEYRQCSCDLLAWSCFGATRKSWIIRRCKLVETPWIIGFLGRGLCFPSLLCLLLFVFWLKS